MSYFNVRVYGLLINSKAEILISDEEESGFQFSKFPGGGVELGEGLIDALKREFIEECETDIDILSHFYTTDFFSPSYFDDSQVISIYYLIKEKSPLQFTTKINRFDFDGEGDKKQIFRWTAISKLEVNEFAFNTDKRVVTLLKDRFV